MRARRVQLLSRGAINNLHSRRLSADGDVAIIIAAACNSIYRQKHNARRPPSQFDFSGPYKSPVRPMVRPWPGHFFCRDFFTILRLLKSSVYFLITLSGQPPPPITTALRHYIHGRTTFQKPTTTMLFMPPPRYGPHYDFELSVCLCVPWRKHSLTLLAVDM